MFVPNGRAFRTAVRVPEDDAIHRARKRVKEVRYQLEWLVPISAPRIRKRQERFARLAQDLGEVTDGIVLEAAVLEPSVERRFVVGDERGGIRVAAHAGGDVHRGARGGMDVTG